MRPNPLRPRTLSDETAFPIEMLRIALTGEASGRRGPSGRPIGQLEAARIVSQAWTSALPREDRDGVAKFYVGVLTSFLTAKSPHTVRSWSSTVCDFFDFVAHDRLKRGTPDLRLVAPHDLMQADVDGYVRSLEVGREPTPEMIVDPQEKIVAEWIYDAFQKNPARAFLEKEIAEGMGAENLSWRNEPAGKELKGFIGKQTGLTAILSALVRKKVLVRSPTAKEAKQQVRGDGRKKYPYEKARYSRPVAAKPATVATQVQRLTALANLWATFNDDASLDIQEEFRPRVLRKNPWVKPRKALFARMPRAADDTARSLRRLYPDDLLALLASLRKRATPKGRGVSIRNVLAKRDELAVLFLVSTGLRVFEALQGRLENLKPGERNELWLLSGIKRKLGGDPVTVFVPRLVLETLQDLRSMVYEYVKKTTEMFGAEWEKTKAEIKERKPSIDEDELADQADREMRGFSNKHRKEDFFREQFTAYLNLKETGPLLPALGRWGNAMVKARATIDSTSGPAVIVPWDENSIRDRFLLMAPKESPLRKRLHPHAFRHLAVALAEDATPGAMAAMALAGHKDARTTDLYRDTVSLRRTATLAIEARLREMLAVVAGTAPPPAAPEEPPAAAPVAPGVVPPAARPEPAQEAPAEPHRLYVLNQSELNQLKIAADLLSVPQLPPQNPDAILREAQIRTPPVVPLPEAPAPKATKITAVGTMVPGGVPLKGTGERKKSPKPVAKALPETGQQAALWSTTPADWFLPARAAVGKDPVPIVSAQVNEILQKGWLPGAPAVSQWKLHPILSSSLVWTGIRTLLPYRIAMNLKVEKEVKWTPESLELTVPSGSKMLRSNAAKSLLPESLVALPLVNFDDQAYLRQLSPILNMAYDQTKASDPAAAKAMTRWLIELRSHSARVKKMVELKNAKAAPADRLQLAWIGSSAEVPVSVWGSAEALGKTRSSVVRNHEPVEVVRFLREQGTTIYGPIGRVSNVEDMVGYDISMESRLQANMDSIEDYQERTSKTGKVRVTQSPRGLHRYKLPAWVTDTDDPIGPGAHGLSDEDRTDLKKWILRAKTARDIVSFEKDAATSGPYWALAFSFASSNDDTIKCPENLEGYRRSYAAKFKVDPLVACRRAIRHLWEVSEAIRGDSPRGGQTIKPEQIDLIWGVFWSWILPSSTEVKNLLRVASEESGKDGIFDTDDIRSVTNRWVDVVTLESLLAVIGQTFDGIMQRVLEYQAKIVAGEKTQADADADVDTFTRDAAKSIVFALWKTMGGDYESINEVMVKALESFGQKLARPDQAKFARMDKKDFSERMDAMSRPIQESAWSPKGYSESRTMAARQEYLSRLGLPADMAKLSYEEYVASLAKFRASTIAMVHIVRMGLYKASVLREIVFETVKPSDAAALKEPSSSIQAIRDAAIQSAARGASLTDAQLELAATVGIQNVARIADLEEIGKGKLGSSIGLEDIQGGESTGGSLSSMSADDKRVGIISGTAENYEKAVFDIVASEKAKGAAQGKAATDAYNKVVVPKIPKGGRVSERELSAQSTAYIAAMARFLSMYGSSLSVDKRTKKAAERLSTREAEEQRRSAASPALQAKAGSGSLVSVYEAAAARVLDEEKAKGVNKGAAAQEAFDKADRVKFPTKRLDAFRKFLAAYNADFDPPMTPNRALTPNLAQVGSSTFLEPALRLLPGIRINPIALILALYA